MSLAENQFFHGHMSWASVILLNDHWGVIMNNNLSPCLKRPESEMGNQWSILSRNGSICFSF